MKKIKLTRGKYALVDDEDYEFLKQQKWCAYKDYNVWYTRAHIWHKNIKKIERLKMHALILERKLGRSIRDGMVPDHKNGNGLDNRRSNLREATPKENSRNREGGVVWRAAYKKWESSGESDGKYYYLGHWKTKRDAQISRDNWARKTFGEFARLYFPGQFLIPKEKPWRNRVSSSHIGVSYVKNMNKWMARIFINEKRIYLGVFETENDAVTAISKAKLNFPRKENNV